MDPFGQAFEPFWATIGGFGVNPDGTNVSQTANSYIIYDQFAGYPKCLGALNISNTYPVDILPIGMGVAGQDFANCDQCIELAPEFHSLQNCQTFIYKGCTTGQYYLFQGDPDVVGNYLQPLGTVVTTLGIEWDTTTQTNVEIAELIL